MIGILIFIFGLIVCIIIAFLVFGGDRYIRRKMEGDKSVKKDVDKTGEPKDKKIMIENEKGELYKYTGKKEISSHEFCTFMDDGETVRDIFRYDKFMIKNTKSYLEDKEHATVLKYLSANTYSLMKADNNALLNILAQKEKQIEDFSPSSGHQRRVVAKEDNEVSKIRWHNIQRRRLDASKGKPSSSSEEGSGEYEELGG